MKMNIAIHEMKKRGIFSVTIGNIQKFLHKLLCFLLCLSELYLYICVYLKFGKEIQCGGLAVLGLNQFLEFFSHLLGWSKSLLVFFHKMALVALSCL